MAERKGTKNVIIEMNDRSFTIDLSIEDVELIETFISALRKYIQEDIQINVKQAYMNLPSDSVHIISKVISRDIHLDEWIAEIRQLITVIRRDI